MKFSTRQIVVSGMLGGASILLAVTGIGFIPMPTGVSATIMHVPAILGGIAQGPASGALVGLIFGVYSFLYPRNPIFGDPLVSILPRIFIGITSYLAYKATKSPALGAAVGTATNTVGVLGMILLRGYLPFKAVASIALIHGIPEVIVAAVITSLLIRSLRGIEQATSTKA